jgi:hypothetical protein
VGAQIHKHGGHNPYQLVPTSRTGRNAIADWEGMTQNFVTTFLFEIQYPTVDKEL